LDEDNESNENEEEEPAMQFFSEVPPEIVAAHREATDRHQMRAVEFRQSVERFFDELTPEQMLTFHRMLVFASNGQSVVDVWLGASMIYLKKIHKICTDCGEASHTEDEHFLFEAAKKGRHSSEDLEKPDAGT
jgi:hypothetical protein